MSRFKIIASFAGYGLWLVGLYLLLTWVTFPWSRIEEQTIVAASDAGWALEFEDVGSAFFGVWAKGINLQPATDDEGNPTEASGVLAGLLSGGIEIDKARIKMPMSRLPTAGYLFLSELLEGRLAPREVLSSAGKIEVEAAFWNGSFAVDLETDPESNRVEIDIQDISLDDYEFRGGFISADPQGTLRSKGNVTWNKEDPKKSSGGIDLFLDSLTVPGLPVVGDVAFSKSEGHIKLSRGRAEIRDTALEADEIQAVIEGFATLSKNIERSRLSIKLRFKVREDLDPLVNAAMMGNTRHKADDGWYHYQISGTLAKPRFRPSPAAARRGKRSPAKSRTSSSDREQNDLNDEVESRQTNTSGRIERPSVTKEDRDDSESRREQLRDERTRRRKERKERREEMMRKRKERQEELGGQGGAARPSIDNAAFILPDDIRPSQMDQDEEQGLEPGDEEEPGDEQDEEGGEDFEEEEGDYEE